MMKKFIFYIMVASVSVCVLNACDDNGLGDPLATNMKIDSSSYNVSIGQTIADTTVATIRWIDIKSPSYKLTLSNSKNDTTIVLSDNSKAADNNVRAMTITDKQILGFLNQMHLTGNTTDTLKLTIAGTRTDGVADSVTATIYVATQNSGSPAARSNDNIHAVSDLLFEQSIQGNKVQMCGNPKVQEKPLFMAYSLELCGSLEALTNQMKGIPELSDNGRTGKDLWSTTYLSLSRGYACDRFA